MHGKSRHSLRKRKPTINKVFKYPSRTNPNPQTQPHLQLETVRFQPQHEYQEGMRNLFHNISAKVRNPNVSAKDLATLTLMLLAGGISYKVLAEADAGVTSDAISQYHLTGRTDTTWGDEMAKLNASIPKTRGGKTRRRSRKYK